MVYHGGNATTYQAIRHAVPMVAIPAHFDHELNARAVAAKGLGISIFPHELTAEGLSKAVDEVVNSSKVAFTLKRFQMLLARRDPPEAGAKLLLEFAGKTRQSPKAEALPIAWVPTSPMAFEETPVILCGRLKTLARKKSRMQFLEASRYIQSFDARIAAWSIVRLDQARTVSGRSNFWNRVGMVQTKL
jgi:hypothetical protein